MITPSQLLLASIILFVIWRTHAAYKKKNLSESFVAVWTIFWLGVLILVFKQDLVSQAAHSLGVSRGVDLVIYISLIVIFYFVYKILVLINDLDGKITQIIRKIAINEAKKRPHR